MKIAQVAPLFESVPPKQYGGTERVIHYLTEELVYQGHDVTLFASGDSHSSARLVAPAVSSARPDVRRPSWLAAHCIALDMVASHAHEFDVIHFHTDYLHFPLARMLATPHLTTTHGRLDLPELTVLFEHFNDVPLTAISSSQRAAAAHAHWIATVHHGLPPGLLPFNAEGGEHFVFLGRFSPEKRVDRAIEIARRCGVPIYLAAKIDEGNQDYFAQQVEPLLNDPLVHYVGEIGDREKAELLGTARALLCPVDWPEPFGLVMIEALSCGTPVIAWRCGAAPEIVEHGVTGFLVSDMDEATAAAQSVHRLDRQVCRASFERRFTAERMAANYVDAYRRLQDQFRH